jgi:hypothetical protein
MLMTMISTMQAIKQRCFVHKLFVLTVAVLMIINTHTSSQLQCWGFTPFKYGTINVHQQQQSTQQQKQQQQSQFQQPNHPRTTWTTSQSQLFGGGFGGGGTGGSDKKSKKSGGGGGGSNSGSSGSDVTKLKPKQQWDRYLDLKRETKIRVAVRCKTEQKNDDDGDSVSSSQSEEEWLEVGRVKSKDDKYTELAVVRQRAIIAEVRCVVAE